jgi:hypothetical protein
MQHLRNTSSNIVAWHRPASVALCVLSLPLLWCVACAQGADTGGGDDGGTTDDSTGAENPVPEQDSSRRPPSSQDASGAQDTGSPGMDGAPDVQDETPSEGGDETVAAEGGDASADAGADSVAEAQVDSAADTGADTGQDAPAVDAGTALRVFVSSKTYDGKLGGALGADGVCNTLATQAGLGGTWMAWVSDTTTSPGQRFTKSTVPYRRLDGVVIASSWANLTSSGLSNAIDVTETNASLAAADSNASKTWTGTTVAGALGTNSCGGFASNASTTTGAVGHCTGTGTVNWTAAYTTETCSVPNHIYCFEQ